MDEQMDSNCKDSMNDRMAYGNMDRTLSNDDVMDNKY